MKRIRPWMLAYLVFFMCLTFISVKNDVENEYPFYYVFLGSFSYMVFNAGILIYAINVRHEAIRGAWKYIFPYLIVYFVVSYVIDCVFGIYADLRPIGILLDVVIFIFATILFFPAFRASFILAYRPIAADSEQKGQKLQAVEVQEPTDV